MPVSALLVDSDIKVKRSPSLRSEQSSLSESRTVRFNQDVSIKRIPKKVTKTKSLPVDAEDEFAGGQCAEFVNIPPPSDQQEIASQAEDILRQLSGLECSVSPTPARVISPTPDSRPGLARRLTLCLVCTLCLSWRGLDEIIVGRRKLFIDGCDGSVRGVSSLDRARAMRVSGYSEQEDSPGPSQGPGNDNNRFYGLQALSNLDNAVNGNKLNNLYRSQDYSHNPNTAKKNNISPPKPPRKAPSVSPPSIRRGYMSHDELDFKSRRSEVFDTMDDRSMDAGASYSYTDKNPNLNHLRNSPTRLMNLRQSLSPSRGGNHTDSEILNSPTQVLYATISADKHKHHHGGNIKNQHMANSASQTVHTGFRPISADRHIPSRTLSKENILDDPPYRMSNGGSSKHGSRSLERFVDEDKENHKRRKEMKARIHVSSPLRLTASPERQSSRKPYRTTINTATDTIQYNGFSTENLGRVDTGHYKVPRNKAPVPAEIISRNGHHRPNPEHSSSAYNGNPGRSGGGGKTQFASTSLVRSADRSGGKVRGEFDREGRRIQSDSRKSERSRAYSGYSTSPDRELSPDRYAKPRGGGGRIQVSSRRSPSTSPTRPPRTRSSPGREHSGRMVERTPSTRAAATSRSPIKKIQRVHNEIIGDRDPSPTKSRTLTLNRNKGEKVGGRGVKNIIVAKLNNKEEDDRLSRFTEYRGTSEEPRGVLANSRRSSTGFDLRKNSDSSGGTFERERGQSVPPGANIESMKDFYKTNQYRSMYHLPPSPTRPAPVLDRSTSRTQTLQRERSGDLVIAPPRRHAKNSVSEGEITDDPARQERVIRHRNKFLNNIVRSDRERQQELKPANSTATLNRRVASNERDRIIYGRGPSQERPVRRQAPQPPTTKVRRSSVDVLETSHSESESPRPDQLRLYSDEEEVSEPLMRHRITVQQGRNHRNNHILYYDNQHRYHQTKLGVVPVVTGPSDVESDYRRDLITGSVHMEARTRDGGQAPPSIYQQAATLNRDKSASKSKLRGRSVEKMTREVEISQDDEEDEMVRAPVSREEERRKIIELERRNEKRPVSVSRSGSRVSKLMGVKSKSKLGAATETENESQYSGHSSSSVALKNRYNLQQGAGRLKRTGSTATTGSARQVISRKKMPGSVTSSVNSSESEHGSAGQSAISRATNQSNLSNRSVFLHATAVADIPSAKPGSVGVQGDNKQLASTSSLQKSKKISRSISLLAPFKKQTAPAAGREKEVIYDSSGQIVHSGKPPRAPPAPIRKIPADPMMTRDKKFASSSDLLQDEAEVMSSPEELSPAKISSKVSRSVSMPKDTRLAGWFKKRKRV